VSLRLRLLGSGSSGNAALVRAGRCRILVDAGLAASRLEAGCRQEGFEPEALECVLISHDHSDHAGSASCFSRRHGLPVFCLDGAEEALARAGRPLPVRLPLLPRLDLGEICVAAFPVPHDAPNVGWRFEAGGASIGLVTDLGHVTKMVVENLRDCNVLMIEANHDPLRLQEGPYPSWLKQRISSPAGHLSNRAAAQLAAAAVGPATRIVVLLHLSERNNRPELARREVQSVLSRMGRADIRVEVASRSGLPQPLEL